ncbi:glycosyltransferase [Pseudochryseolinea flava]|uniref:Glycosyltransferase family 1 protein n=1 Tax=Pseudochryseolinea flava TaxID=2059302 RepID=A0A364Y4D4_9BACT|nr:glycosyltransferase [Pseudochryseolinea flava]RAW01792.1 hypothetical protein DQQ10_09100 [Pseudochryseolinea flava]
MTTVIRDIVCLLNKQQYSFPETFQSLERVKCESSRVFMIHYPHYQQDHEGYSISVEERLVHIQLYTCANSEAANEALRETISKIFYDFNIDRYMLWYDTSAAYGWTDHLLPSATVYHCTDLVATENASQQMLLQRASTILTDGLSAHEYLKTKFSNVYLLKSRVDLENFYEARYYKKDPIGQVNIPYPRIGCFGDGHLFDVELIKTLAETRPHWQFVVIADTQDLELLSKFNNIHLLGWRGESKLAEYISNWDVGIIPYGDENKRRFQNPKEITQLLAAGKPVVSTSMTDVLRTFGQNKLVRIAGTSAQMIMMIQEELKQRDRVQWYNNVKDFLNERSLHNSLESVQFHFRTHYKFESTCKLSDSHKVEPASA